MKKEHQYKVGVVIGRFQVPELTAGHRHLIDSALRLCQRRLILIGSAGAAFTSRNPLPYEAREDMIKSTYDSEDITIARLHDASDDQAWSENVDETIKYHFGSLLTTAEPAVLLHGRDSFAKHYTTRRHPLLEIPEIQDVNGTTVRRNIELESSAAFRRGIIYATLHRERL